MKRRELIRHLTAEGCHLIREGGRHSVWGNPSNHRKTAVPRHAEIRDLLGRKICRDVGVREP